MENTMMNTPNTAVLDAITNIIESAEQPITHDDLLDALILRFPPSANDGRMATEIQECYLDAMIREACDMEIIREHIHAHDNCIPTGYITCTYTPIAK